MKKVIIERIESSDHGTFGRLLVDELAFFTGELPWRGNLSDVSCIPEGKYRGRWTFSARFKRKMYEIWPVESRAGIRVHSANLMGDRWKGFRAQLNGCVALGEKIGWIEGQKAVMLSAPAVRKFERHMDCQPFELEVRNGHS